MATWWDMKEDGIKINNNCGNNSYTGSIEAKSTTILKLN